MAGIEIMEMLNLSINNGECLELIKDKRENLKCFLANLTDGENHNHVVRMAREYMAYDVLIKSFEDYLGHKK